MSNESDVLARVEAEERGDIQRVDMSAVAVLNRSEVEAQLDAAHKHRRSATRFLQEAMTLSTLSREVAESCLYAVPRDGKTITGPSVRLAEIAASAYGNLHIGARVVDEEERHIVAQGVAWDLEKNLRVTVEVKRRITNSKGKRYSEDMITMTGNAAASIARRNAVFQVIPRAYIQAIYEKARSVAVGNAQTLVARRTEVLERLAKYGVDAPRVLLRLGKVAVTDIGLEEIETLIGLGTAIKSGDQSVDHAFPAATPAGTAASTETKSLEEKLRAQGAAKGKKAEPPAASATATPSPQTAPPGATLERCCYCKEPVGPEGLAVLDVEGVIHKKHPLCTAFGKGREPGED